MLIFRIYKKKQPADLIPQIAYNSLQNFILFQVLLILNRVYFYRYPEFERL